MAYTRELPIRRAVSVREGARESGGCILHAAKGCFRRFRCVLRASKCRRASLGAEREKACDGSLPAEHLAVLPREASYKRTSQGERSQSDPRTAGGVIASEREADGEQKTFAFAASVDANPGGF